MKEKESLKERILLNNAPFIRQPFEEFVSAAKELGCIDVDLTLQAPHFYVDSSMYILPEKMQEYGLRVRCVTPLPYRYTICADAGSIQREKSVAYYTQCIMAAKELGAQYVCITGSGANYDADPNQLMANAADTLRVLCERAGQAGVTLLLGTVLGEECVVNASTPVLVHLDEIAEVVQKIDSPALMAYLDTEVISVCGESISAWFDALADKIGLIRFSDGNYHGYRIWGRGCLPCRKYLQEISECGYQGVLSLHMPGERYVEMAMEATRENMTYLLQNAAQSKGE